MNTRRRRLPRYLLKLHEALHGPEGLGYLHDQVAASKDWTDHDESEHEEGDQRLNGQDPRVNAHHRDEDDEY